MAGEVERWDRERDGEPTEDALRQLIEAEGYSTSVYVYPPGTVFPEHSHGVDKIDAVVSGRFRMRMQGATVVLEAGDRVRVPCGVVHRAEVVGNAPVVSIDGVRRQGV
jgi:mannose-6-phosphate isomerase-like protein (cupin superfamily)